MSSIPELEAEKVRIHTLFSKADAALHHGSISVAEREALLNSYFQTADERVALGVVDAELSLLRAAAVPDHGVNKTALLVVGFSLLMVSLFATLFFSTTGGTGAVVFSVDRNLSPLLLPGQSVTVVPVTGLLVQGDIVVYDRGGVRVLRRVRGVAGDHVPTEELSTGFVPVGMVLLGEGVGDTPQSTVFSLVPLRSLVGVAVVD